ncbi:MAG: hypothetical protein MZV63_33810 [Marinilabiliales bacterium]|nr:hypothetical protein [Marinilabiliales bacterium]
MESGLPRQMTSRARCHLRGISQGYKTGTNAAIFSPQGGLRISAVELAKDNDPAHE